MTDTKNITDIVKASLNKRHRTERKFKWMGGTAVSIGFLLVFVLLTDITIKALPAFHQHWVSLDIQYKEQWLSINTDQVLDEKTIKSGNFRKVLKSSLYEMFPDVSGRSNKRKLTQMISSDAEFEIRDQLLESPSLMNQKQTLWLRFDDDVDTYLKESDQLGQAGYRLNEKQALWLKALKDDKRIEKRFNVSFFTNGDSREPELAGIKGAMMGTMITMLVTLILSFPLGVAAALYLEEFAPKNRWTDIIEVNINNLAAVPSIIFGLLGLAVIINIFGLPRSAPLVGGIVLTLMTLPTIIIASRASIKAVPPSIREAAYGIGASKVQTAFGHVLPMAMPGILTGTIIGMAQALGETAPLLMIGMVAFIVDVPTSITDAATVMPVQIFLWADSPERAFLAKTSAAILVLLSFLFVMNTLAAILRKKFENNQ